jgi:alkylated DNA repair protein alkB homolog 1
MLSLATRMHSWLTSIDRKFAPAPLWFQYRKDSPPSSFMLVTDSHSVGSAAIFLLGGTTREVEPIPILLRSGDVVIMSGPECRRAYHGLSACHLNSLEAKKSEGVPRILEGTTPPHLRLDVDEEDWEPYAQYIRTARINLNVRQVFPKNFQPAW